MRVHVCTRVEKHTHTQIKVHSTLTTGQKPETKHTHSTLLGVRTMSTKDHRVLPDRKD